MTIAEKCPARPRWPEKKVFRIRIIFDEILPINKEALRQVREILTAQFEDAPPADARRIGEKLHNPFAQQFRSFLCVAETGRRKVLGFALIHHDPVLKFCFLDYLAAASRLTGGGIGGALYEQVRKQALALGAKGLFFECLPDDPEACPDPALLKENKMRLRFYERYGARPVINTRYEMPVSPEDTCMPHFVFDGLDREKLPCGFARKVVRAILERKYRTLCPPPYVRTVVNSFKDDPVRLREPRYVKPRQPARLHTHKSRETAALVANDRHAIHHIHERGYVESPVRIRSIMRKIETCDLFQAVRLKNFPEKHLKAVHAPDFLNYLRRASLEVPEKKSLYPYVFPIRNAARPPKDRSVLAGYYCIDTFTPINRTAYLAARRAVDCALSAAGEIVNGRRVAYALVRPPGHHAERRSFGGFCYFNNTAVAAQYLCAYGKIAVLDVDYHHGNGQQEIFYDRSDVLTVSIHGHPRFAYPYFSGFADERGSGPGEGFNRNFPLPEIRNGEQYRRTLAMALKVIQDFKPLFLVVALGLDTAKMDPTGTWSLVASDFVENGRMIAKIATPVLVIQKGGYKTQTLGLNARSFFEGLLT